MNSTDLIYTMSIKRKGTVLLKDKLNVIECLKKKENMVFVLLAIEYDVRKFTIRNIKNNESM